MISSSCFTPVSSLSIKLIVGGVLVGGVILGGVVGGVGFIWGTWITLGVSWGINCGINGSGIPPSAVKAGLVTITTVAVGLNVINWLTTPPLWSSTCTSNVSWALYTPVVGFNAIPVTFWFCT